MSEVKDLNETAVQKAKGALNKGWEAREDEAFSNFFNELCMTRPDEMRPLMVKHLYRIYDLSPEEYMIDITAEDIRVVAAGEISDEEFQSRIIIEEIPKAERPEPDRKGLRVVSQEKEGKDNDAGRSTKKTRRKTEGKESASK